MAGSPQAVFAERRERGASLGLGQLTAGWMALELMALVVACEWSFEAFHQDGVVVFFGVSAVRMARTSWYPLKAM